MSTTPQKRALSRYRKRLNQRGMARFEVLGRDTDRELIRLLARRLAADDPDSARIRATVRLAVSGQDSQKGGILNALRMNLRLPHQTPPGCYQLPISITIA